MLNAHIVFEEKCVGLCLLVVAARVAPEEMANWALDVDVWSAEGT